MANWPYVPVVLLILGMGWDASAQISEYAYRRPVQGIQDTWHRLPLPDGVFGKTSPILHDIRLFGFTSNGDTVEAPYLLEVLGRKTQNQAIETNILNRTQKDGDYYFTIALPEAAKANRLRLQFGQDNFDWRVKLEGSQNQQEWFEIVDNYRVLSIKNDHTDYQFTDIRFSDVQYRYLRLSVPSASKVTLDGATVSQRQVIEGRQRTYSIVSQQRRDNAERKQTIFELSLNKPLPVSEIAVEVAADFDYYRPIYLQFLADSAKRQDGWHPIYQGLGEGTLSSLEPNIFYFSNPIVQHLRIVIENFDNAPLPDITFSVKGDVHQLKARFTEKADYYLYYGYHLAPRPQYELAYFKDKIPDTPTPLTLGEEEILQQPKAATNPLFENPIWLWGIMVVVIGVLGWFAIKMLK